LLKLRRARLYNLGEALAETGRRDDGTNRVSLNPTGLGAILVK
jgi:hypothetical protein